MYKDDLELRVREQSHSVSRFFFATDRTPRSSLLKLPIVVIQKFATMVTWRFISPLYKHWYRLIIVEPRLRSLKRGLVISRFFSIHYTVTVAENIVRYIEEFLYRGSLYRGLRYIEFRYIEVPLYERERELGLTPLPRFWFLPQFSHSHPFESRLIPTPSVVEIRNGSQLIPSTIFLYQSVSTWAARN